LPTFFINMLEQAQATAAASTSTRPATVKVPSIELAMSATPEKARTMPAICSGRGRSPYTRKARRTVKKACD